MKTKILVLVVVLVGFAMACKKNVYNTKPTLKIKSMNGNVFNSDGTLVLELEVTDKEGDVTDSLYSKRIRLNQNVRPTIRDVNFFKVPEAPDTQDGVIQLNLGYQNYLIATSSGAENDTIAFQFALRDKAGNVSDTITTAPIVVIR